MKNSQLNRVIRLVNKTNDKVVVMDQETEEVVVLVPFDSYEQYVNTGRPVADGRGLEDEPKKIVEKPVPPAARLVSQSPVEPSSDNSNGLKFGQEWEKTEDTGADAEDNLPDIPEDEEEKFYLEPVE